ncbi:putative calcium-binding protein CML27 [Bidens hawaiensis]|uniref:putative calcium-binding protein CML27 n=1 Tax=Bidens hawaiensis TaxID=980011 RepID=UPI00404AFC92
MADKSSNGTTIDVEKIFNKFDTNGDGQIDISELGSATPEEELKVVMAEIDTDGDGVIDIHEFAEFQRRGCTSTDAGAADKELRDAFDLYDIDKNGKISVTELHSVLKSLGGKCSLKDCGKMIQSVDVDGDGCVNFQEFMKMMTK